MKNTPEDKIKIAQKNQHVSTQDKNKNPEPLDDPHSDFFLPDLCKVQSVFFLLIVTELVALLFTLGHPSNELLDWNYLGLISLFGHWAVLTSAAILCIARPTLAKLSINIAATIAFIIIIAITIVYSLIADHFLRPQSGNLQLGHLIWLDIPNITWGVLSFGKIPCHTGRIVHCAAR